MVVAGFLVRSSHPSSSGTPPNDNCSQALAVSLSPGLFLYPSALERRHRVASANLAKARKDARIFAEERRKDVRRRVAAHRLREQQLEEKCPSTAAST
jgi:hypothetical protein